MFGCVGEQAGERGRQMPTQAVPRYGYFLCGHFFQTFPLYRIFGEDNPLDFSRIKEITLVFQFVFPKVFGEDIFAWNGKGIGRLILCGQSQIRFDSCRSELILDNALPKIVHIDDLVVRQTVKGNIPSVHGNQIILS